MRNGSRPSWVRPLEVVLLHHRRGLEIPAFVKWWARFWVSRSRMRVVERSGWWVVVCGCCDRGVCFGCSVDRGRVTTHAWEAFHRGASVCSLGREPAKPLGGP